MSVDQEKRMAGDYVIIHAFHIGDREIVLGENPSGVDGERYMCAFCQSNGLMAGYTEVMVSDDYPELAKLFGERVAEQAEKTRIALSGPKIQGVGSLLKHPSRPQGALDKRRKLRSKLPAPLHRQLVWRRGQL